MASFCRNFNLNNLSERDDPLNAVVSSANASLRAGCPADYAGGCIANLAATLATRFDVDAAIGGMHDSLDQSLQFSERLQAAQTVFLIVLDGVGTRQLSSHCPAGALAAYQQGTLTSVFPSSTAPAITSLLTASAPATHANPAWYAHLPQADRILRTLPMSIRGHPDECVPDDFWPWHGWTQRVRSATECLAFQPRAIYESAYSRQALAGCKRLAYEELAELVPMMSAVARQPATTEGRFVYVYLPQFDSTSHDFGWQSDQALHCLQGFDQWFEQCLTQLAGLDALMVVLADHGFIDIAPACQHHLDDFQPLRACLQAPLAGEPRTVFCRVDPGKERSFMEALQHSRLGEVSDCVRSADLVLAGWFGPSPDAQLTARCGTHTLLMHDGHTLTDRLDNERPMHFIGMHGGMALDEMQVPLIMAGVK